MKLKYLITITLALLAAQPIYTTDQKTITGDLTKAKIKAFADCVIFAGNITFNYLAYKFPCQQKLPYYLGFGFIAVPLAAWACSKALKEEKQKDLVKSVGFVASPLGPPVMGIHLVSSLKTYYDLKRTL